MTINNGKRVILFIEPNFLSHTLIIRAKEKGYLPLIISSKASPHPLSEVGFSHYLLDTCDEEGVIDLIRKLNQKFYIAGVIPSYGGCVLSSKIALYLNQLGLNPETISKIQKQDDMRQSLKLQGIPLPKYEKIEKIEEFESALKKIKLPCLIKPLELGFVRKAKKIQNFKEALENFKAMTIQKKEEEQRQTGIIIEEYIFGDEFIIDGFVKQNQLYLFALAESLYSPHKHFEKIGYLLRSEARFRIEIERYLKTVFSALKLEFGPFHAKIKMTSRGPLLIGLTLNFAKHHVIDLIKYSSGVNYVENTLRLFLGTPLTLRKTHDLNAGIIFFYNSRRKKNRSTPSFETFIKNLCIKEVKYLLQKNPKSLKKTTGYVILAHEDYDILAQHIKKIKEILFPSHIINTISSIKD